MKAKVKKLFSETFVKTYDYPFIIGFLEANGINGIVPSFEQNENRALLSYDKFKQWWKKNCTQKQPKDADERVNEAKIGIRLEENTRNGKIEHIAVLGDKSYAINLAEVLDEFLEYNTKQAERFIFERPHFKGLEYFIRKYIVSDILG